MYISEEKFREKGKKFFFSLLRSFVEQLQRKHPCIYTDVKYFKDDGKRRDRLRCIYIYIYIYKFYERRDRLERTSLSLVLSFHRHFYRRG